MMERYQTLQRIYCGHQKLLNRWQGSLCWLAMGLSLTACIEALDIETEEQRRILVVEGSIDTQPGPHIVTISNSARYGSVFQGVVRKEKNATVRIRDQFGEQVFLDEMVDGTYQTPASFRGVVGHTYTLLITTLDDIDYISMPETITPAPAIDSLLLRFRKITTSTAGDFRSGVEVFSQWQDPPAEQNFYMWKNHGTYLINTRPDLFAFVDPFSGDLIPAPKDCCATCWITESDADGSVRVFSDSRSNGNINTELVAFIEDDGGRYMDKYLVTVEQRSISREAFQFFKLLENQLSIDGDIFDPPPATIRGNMLNLDDPDSPVIGYFHASDIAVDSVFIPTSILEDTQQDRQVNDDCLTLPNSTTIRPIYW